MQTSDVVVMMRRLNYMKKLIDIPDEIVKPLKIMAVNNDRDLKNYIQEVLISHVKKSN